MLAPWSGWHYKPQAERVESLDHSSSTKDRLYDILKTLEPVCHVFMYDV